MEQYFDNYKRQLNLLLDRNRTLKYKYAILNAIQPDDIVIDFGCGTGILGFFALQAGARHVYAIEETSIIEYAQQLAVKNNVEDKITFIHKSGKQVNAQDIPEKVDAILSEPISNLLLEGNAWSTIEYLKSFLKKDGFIIPESGTLFIVPVNRAPETFQDASSLLSGENVYNVNFLKIPHAVFYKSDGRPDVWLAKPQPILERNLITDVLSDTFQNSVKFTVQEPGQLAGVEFYFEVKVFENTTVSSKEQMDYPSWNPLFAPSEPRSVCKDDKLRITVHNEIISPYKEVWKIEFEHHSKLLPSTDIWWKTKAAIPKLAPGVLLTKTGLLRLKQNDYNQYDCDTDLEREFVQLLPKDLNVSEICQIIAESGSFELSSEKIQENLVKFLHKLLLNSLIDMPIPQERFQITNFQSYIHIP
ncbi:MAG: 50S ribosomal protein L11 methyltransferase [Candidatus Helarchaeota archaeon]|nr:50S ribosomal protein L11 methyltransferase [Candidatus Helarchaeota archaeon]